MATSRMARRMLFSQSMTIRPCPVHGENHLFFLTRRGALIGMASVGAALFVCACGVSAEEAIHEVKAPYPSWNTQIKSEYLRPLPDGTTSRYVTRNAGEQVVEGRTYNRLRMERASNDPSAPPPETGAEIWLNPDGESKVVLAGGAYNSETAAKLGLPASGSATLTTPFTIDFGAKIGEPQPIDVKGTVMLKGTTTSALVGAVGSYTIVEHDVAVDTPTGKISGCTHITLEGKVPLVFGASLVQTRGQLWISRSLGVVQARFDEPLSGFGLDVKGTHSSRDLGDGYASVEGVGVVGAGVSRFEVSTTDVHGKLDADKMTHASLLMEVRWVDESMARTDKQPYANQTLGTVMGYFPSNFVQSPISFLHPEERDKGYVYWIAYANQAAKNEPGSNETGYTASVRYDPSFSPIRVSARIIYKKLSV